MPTPRNIASDLPTGTEDAIAHLLATDTDIQRAVKGLTLTAFAELAKLMVHGPPPIRASIASKFLGVFTKAMAQTNTGGVDELRAEMQEMMAEMRAAFTDEATLDHEEGDDDRASPPPPADQAGVVQSAVPVEADSQQRQHRQRPEEPDRPKLHHRPPVKAGLDTPIAVDVDGPLAKVIPHPHSFDPFALAADD